MTSNWKTKPRNWLSFRTSSESFQVFKTRRPYDINYLYNIENEKNEREKKNQIEHNNIKKHNNHISDCCCCCIVSIVLYWIVRMLFTFEWGALCSHEVLKMISAFFFFSFIYLATFQDISIDACGCGCYLYEWLRFDFGFFLKSAHFHRWTVGKRF